MLQRPQFGGVQVLFTWPSACLKTACTASFTKQSNFDDFKAQLFMFHPPKSNLLSALCPPLAIFYAFLVLLLILTFFEVLRQDKWGCWVFFLFYFPGWRSLPLKDSGLMWWHPSLTICAELSMLCGAELSWITYWLLFYCKESWIVYI